MIFVLSLSLSLAVFKGPASFQAIFNEPLPLCLRHYESHAPPMEYGLYFACL